MTRNWIGGPPDMDPFTNTDLPPVHVIPAHRSTYRRGRFSWAGFFRHPSVMGACVGIILACAIAGGLILVRMVEVIR